MEPELDSPALPNGISTKLVVGLFFSALGVLLTLGNLRLIDDDRYLRYWPIVFIAIGLAKLPDVTGRGFAVVMIALGSLLIAMNTRWMRFSVFDLWPLLLIGAGAVIVAQALGLRPEIPAGERTGNIWAVLSNRRIAIDSRDFKGGRLVAFMGGCQLDLTEADIQHGPAVIELLVLMGGIDMRIPDGWEVIGEAVPFMGGIEIKTRSKRTNRRLVLRGFVMMGGVDVKDAAARTK
jgi:cell wall-active antibiotic response 4TMS protein YvqF